MAVISPATRITLPLNRPFLHRSTLGSLHCTSRKFLFLRNPIPSSSIVAVRCQKPISDGVSSMETMNHVSSAASSIDFLTLCHRLKTTKRKGWINQGINGPESIADHMYRMALMALIADDLTGVDRERCIKMAIVHDIAEVIFRKQKIHGGLEDTNFYSFQCLSKVIFLYNLCMLFFFATSILQNDKASHLTGFSTAIVGDITPSDGVPKEEKSRREKAALKEMCKVLGGGLRAEEITELWLEYENNASLEANLVKDFDKVELILQALEYEAEHGKVLDEFFISTAGKFQTEIGKSWAAEINARRKCQLTNKQR